VGLGHVLAFHFFMVVTGGSDMTRFRGGPGECAAGCGFYLFMVAFVVYRMI
jgi:hypothetical protein